MCVCVICCTFEKLTCHIQKGPKRSGSSSNHHFSKTMFILWDCIWHILHIWQISWWEKGNSPSQLKTDVRLSEVYARYMVKIPQNKKTKALRKHARAQGLQSATVTWIKQRDSNSSPIPSPYKVNTGLILIHHMTTMCIKGRSTSTIATKGDIKDQFHILEVLRFTILRRFRFQVCFFFFRIFRCKRWDPKISMKL